MKPRKPLDLNKQLRWRIIFFTSMLSYERRWWKMLTPKESKSSVECEKAESFTIYFWGILLLNVTFRMNSWVVQWKICKLELSLSGLQDASNSQLISVANQQTTRNTRRIVDEMFDGVNSQQQNFFIMKICVYRFCLFSELISCCTARYAHAKGISD